MLTKQDELIQKEAAYQNILSGLAEGVPVVAEKKDINEFYETKYVPNLAGKSPEDVLSGTASFIRGTKTVPDALKRELNAMILSENPDQIMNAARVIDAIDDIPGITEQALSTEQRAFISQVIPLMQNQSPAEAVRIAKQITDPANTARIEPRKEILKKKDNYAAEVSSELDPWFGADIKPVNVDQLNSEYKKIYDAYFLSGMTESAAKQQAVKTLKRNWGEFNGYIMKYPPQQFYEVAGDSGYIMDQLVKDIATETIGEFEVTKDQLYLIADERTAKEADIGKPSYRVMIVTDEGIKPLAGFRWMPDAAAQIKKVQEKNRKMQALESVTVESIEVADEYLSANAPDWYDASGRSEAQRIEDAKDFMRGTYREKTTVDVGLPVAE